MIRVVILCALFCCVACNDLSTAPVDQREPYIGTWQAQQRDMDDTTVTWVYVLALCRDSTWSIGYNYLGGGSNGSLFGTWDMTDATTLRLSGERRGVSYWGLYDGKKIGPDVLYLARLNGDPMVDVPGDTLTLSRR